MWPCRRLSSKAPVGVILVHIASLWVPFGPCWTLMKLSRNHLDALRAFLIVLVRARTNLCVELRARAFYLRQVGLVSCARARTSGLRARALVR